MSEQNPKFDKTIQQIEEDNDINKYYPFSGVNVLIKKEENPLALYKEKFKEEYDLGFFNNSHFYLYMFRKGEPDHVIRFIMIQVTEFGMDMEGKELLSIETIFKGSGNSMDEMRHTWWGDKEGYMFYTPGIALIKAFEILQKEFNFD